MHDTPPYPTMRLSERVGHPLLCCSVLGWGEVFDPTLRERQRREGWGTRAVWVWGNGLKQATARTGNGTQWWGREVVGLVFWFGGDFAEDELLGQAVDHAASGGYQGVAED